MSRRCLRPLIIEPKKPLKTEAKSRFRAKPHGPDNPYYRTLPRPEPADSSLDDLGDRLPREPVAEPVVHLDEV